MTRRTTRLEDRLTEWGREYGGGKYGIKGNIEGGIVMGAIYGDSPLASLMKWHGRPPDGLGHEPSCSAADEVDEAVRALASQPQGLLPSVIVTLEYWLPGQPIESKQARLRKRGDHVGRTTYYKHLREARKFIANHLRLPYCEQKEDVNYDAA